MVQVRDEPAWRQSVTAAREGGSRPGRSEGSDVAPARNINDKRLNVRIAQIGQSIGVVDHELGFPEWVLQPRPFQLVDEHPQFRL